METMYGDIWMFDPLIQKWEPRREITNSTDSTFDDLYTTIVRAYGVSFVINGKGYLATGAYTLQLIPTLGNMIQLMIYGQKKPRFEGNARYGAVAFSVSNRGFVTTGLSGSSRYDDCFEFLPNAAVNAYNNHH